MSDSIRKKQAKLSNPQQSVTETYLVAFSTDEFGELNIRSQKKVKSRDVTQLSIPEWADVIQVFDVNAEGEAFNHSPKYFAGIKVSLKDLKEINAATGKYTFQIFDMEFWGTQRAVITETGACHTLEGKDTLLLDAQKRAFSLQKKQLKKRQSETGRVIKQALYRY